MTEQNEQQNTVPTTTDDQELKAIIARLQQQMGYLEKKIDLLMAQLKEKPALAQPPFRPAPRPFGDAGRRPEGGFTGGYRGKRPYPGPRLDAPRGDAQPRSAGFSRPAHGFEKFNSRDKRAGFGPRKPFPSKRTGGYRR